MASTEDGTEQRLLSETPDTRPERNLTEFDALQFSPDGRTLFFLTEAWTTSAAIRAIDIHTREERFVVDANAVLVIPRGPHAGRLFVKRHRYKTSPGQDLGSYEWCGVVDERGRTIRTLSTDESLCPQHALDDPKKVDQALRIPSSHRATVP